MLFRSEPNISLRMTGTEDLLNPLTLAFLLKSGQAPSEEEIEAAKKLIQVTVTPPPGTQSVPGGPQGGPEGPLSAMPPGLMGSLSPEQQAALAAQVASGEIGPGGPGVPSAEAQMLPPIPSGIGAPPPLPFGAANPEWGLMPKIKQRT